MSQVAELILDTGKLYAWLVQALQSAQNPKGRDPEFLFDIGRETWLKYLGYARDAAQGHPERKRPKLPDGKMIKKIVMSRGFSLMQKEDRRTLIRIWAHIAITSAGKGNPPSAEYIEFIHYVLGKCPEQTLEKAVREVRNLKH